MLKPSSALVAASESFSDEDRQIAKQKGVRIAFVEADVTAKFLAQRTELLDTQEIISA